MTAADGADRPGTTRRGPADAGRIAHLARLARLRLRPEEAERLAADLEMILDLFALVATSQPSGEPDPDVGPRREEPGGVAPANVPSVAALAATREDTPRPGLSFDEALGPAHRVRDEYFVVPKVLPSLDEEGEPSEGS